MRYGSVARLEANAVCRRPSLTESAGCEARSALRPAHEIRSALLPGAKRPATTGSSAGAVFSAERAWLALFPFPYFSSSHTFQSAGKLIF